MQIYRLHFRGAGQIFFFQILSFDQEDNTGESFPGTVCGISGSQQVYNIRSCIDLGIPDRVRQALR